MTQEKTVMQKYGPILVGFVLSYLGGGLSFNYDRIYDFVVTAPERVVKLEEQISDHESRILRLESPEFNVEE